MLELKTRADQKYFVVIRRLNVGSDNIVGGGKKVERKE